MTSIPLASTERVRDDSTLPLPLFLRRFRLMLPPPEAFRNIPSYCVPFRTVVKPVLLCVFFHLASLTLTHIRPDYIEKSPFASNLLPRRSFWLHYGACRPSVQSSFTFFRRRAGAGSSHAPLFQFFILAHCCPLLSVHWSGPLHQHLLNVSWAHKPHVNFCLIAENHVCQYGPFYTRSRVSHITAPAGS